MPLNLLTPRFAVIAGGLILAQSGVFCQGQDCYEGDGEPSAAEEAVRWHLNRGRFDAAAENVRWGTTFSEVPPSLPPLAPHASLNNAARRHSADMDAAGKLQHQTLPGSAYYDADEVSSPWERMTHEGYFWSDAAENIAKGYRDAVDAYEGWWRSATHRVYMYADDYREIGIGVTDNYQAMMLGSRINDQPFFTGTLFHDENGNDTYDVGEGVPGIQISLLLEETNTPHTWCDVSAAAGNFAIPIDAIRLDTKITVRATATGSYRREIHLPCPDGSCELVSLEPGRPLSLGSFQTTSGYASVGLRDLQLSDPHPPGVGHLKIRPIPGSQLVQLQWPTTSGFAYRLLTSRNLQQWEPISGFTPATPSAIGELTFYAGDAQRYFRLERQSN